jgi:hypothetical protein
MMATTTGWLRNVNAAARKPNEDAALLLIAPRAERQAEGMT